MDLFLVLACPCFKVVQNVQWNQQPYTYLCQGCSCHGPKFNGVRNSGPGLLFKIRNPMKPLYFNTVGSRHNTYLNTEVSGLLSNS